MVPVFLRRLSFLVLLPFVVGCASLTVENMVTDQTSFGVQHPVTVALDVGGGSAGVKWYSGTIEPEALNDAVKMSLKKTSLFEVIDDPATADYVLGVNLTYAGSHPGFDMGAWVNMTWSLLQHGMTETIWSIEIKSEGHATTGEAFVGAKRQFMALERAAKANIDQAFTEIAKLSLASP